jgi:DNA-directed RNA polymerase specialized sigma24 family protein
MILHAIQTVLAEDQRRVILLRLPEPFRPRESAAILGKQVRRVQVIQGRAIAKLRNVFVSREFRTVVSLPRVRGRSKARGL